MGGSSDTITVNFGDRIKAEFTPEGKLHLLSTDHIDAFSELIKLSYFLCPKNYDVMGHMTGEKDLDVITFNKHLFPVSVMQVIVGNLDKFEPLSSYLKETGLIKQKLKNSFACIGETYNNIVIKGQNGYKNIYDHVVYLSSVCQFRSDIISAAEIIGHDITYDDGTPEEIIARNISESMGVNGDLSWAEIKRRL